MKTPQHGPFLMVLASLRNIFLHIFEKDDCTRCFKFDVFALSGKKWWSRVYFVTKIIFSRILKSLVMSKLRHLVWNTLWIHPFLTCIFSFSVIFLKLFLKFVSCSLKILIYFLFRDIEVLWTITITLTSLYSYCWSNMFYSKYTPSGNLQSLVGKQKDINWFEILFHIKLSRLNNT